MSFLLPQPSQSPGFMLWRATNRWQRAINHALKKQDLTHVQFVLLAGLLWHQTQKQTVTQVQLAVFCEVDVMMTSKVMRTLVQKQLVTRQPHPADGRAFSVTLTLAGEAKALASLQLVELADQYFFSPLGQEHQATFTLLLHKLATATVT